MFHGNFRIVMMTATLSLPSLALGAPAPGGDAAGQPGRLGRGHGHGHGHGQAQQVKQGAQRPFGGEGDEDYGEKLSEPEVAGILASANGAVLEIAKLAVSRATAQEIKEFAAMLVKDHSDVTRRAGEVNSQLGQEPRESMKSMQLKASSILNLAILNAAQGIEFDKMFLGQTIERHEELLGLIDGELVPAAQSDKLKAFLTDLRSVVVAHIEAAKKLHFDLVDVPS